MKTHIWVKGMGDMQYVPIATLVLSMRHPGSLGESSYLANGIVITRERWDVLKEEIDAHATALDNMAKGY